MDVTLQYFDDCPNWKITDRHLRTLIAEQARDATLHHQLINTPEAAAEHGFRGSPSVLIDGTDPFADPGAPVGPGWRVYLTENGRASAPTLHQLKGAINAAQAGE